MMINKFNKSLKMQLKHTSKNTAQKSLMINKNYGLKMVLKKDTSQE